MKSEGPEKWLEEGPKETPIEFYDLIHSPEFEKEMENEPWDEYKQENFQ